MRRYEESVFRASHNSYEEGRGAIAAQLDSGVRFLELDVHTDGFRRRGYTVGHLVPGHGVDHGGGNPRGDGLEAWLAAVGRWSEANEHAPITITFDPKDDLTDPESHADGNFGALNDLLTGAFGDRLVRAWEIGNDPWPSLEKLHGRIVCVLSGDHGGRLGYVRDGGDDPAVALGPDGIVVETHTSGGGGLWYWTGRLGESGVRWARHGRYASGLAPAVAVSDSGAVVSVHDATGFGARGRVGRIDPDSLEIAWGSEQEAPLPRVASSARPDVRFEDGEAIRVTYESSAGRLAHGGRVTGSRIVWDKGGPEPASADDARHHREHAVRDGVELSVVSVPDGGGKTRLMCGRPGGATEPIRYEQVLFVEGKFAGGDTAHDLEPVVPPDEPRFFAAGAGGGRRLDWGRDLRGRGKLVRLWGFDDDAAARDFVPSFPACDHPLEDWYARYCDGHDALDPPG